MTERESQRLAKLTEKMEQMKAQKQDILAKEKKRQRKERTHRLIQIGALSEKYFDVRDIQPSDYEIFLKTFMAIKNIPECITNTKNYISNSNTKGESSSSHEQGTNTEGSTNGHSTIPNQ